MDHTPAGTGNYFSHGSLSKKFFVEFKSESLKNKKSFKISTIVNEIFFPGLNFKYLGDKSLVLISAMDHLVIFFSWNSNLKVLKTIKFQNFNNCK